MLWIFQNSPVFVHNLKTCLPFLKIHALLSRIFENVMIFVRNSSNMGANQPPLGAEEGAWSVEHVFFCDVLY